LALYRVDGEVTMLDVGLIIPTRDSAHVARLCLERGETVKLSSFGSFVVRKKGQRVGRNPKTGKAAAGAPVVIVHLRLDWREGSPQLPGARLWTVHWLMGRGVKFLPNYGRQAYNHEGRFKFFGGIVIYANGGGAGLVESEYKAAAKSGIAIHYARRAMALLRGPKGIEGVRIVANGSEEVIRAPAIVLACGGFEANREWRARYLGPGWDMAKVRGTRYNTGDGIRMALDIGAQSYGQWSGCHAVAWERYAGDYGDYDN